MKDRAGNTLVEFDQDLGCALFKGPTTKDGHWQIQRRPRYLTRQASRAQGSSNAHRAYYVHRIAYVALHGRDIALTGSHLCGRANCFNPYHIYDESQHLNNDRQRCLGFVVCPHHNHVLVKLCVHSPACIKPPVKAVQCCLEASRGLAIADSQEDSPVELPPPVIALPAVQRIQDFLQAQPNLPEDNIQDSPFVGTSQESATDLLESGSSNIESQEAQESQGSGLESQTIMDLDFPSSSQGPEYAGGGDAV